MAALGELYQRYMDLVFGVCLKYFKDAERSKDAVMQIFEELVSKLKKHEVENFRGWLHQVAKNHCLMQIRGQKNKWTEPIDESREQAEADDERLVSLLEKEGMLQLLEECLSELNPEQQRCVTLFYLENLSYQEIAESSGFTLLQVKSHIQNGKRNLKIAFDKKSALKKS